MKTFDFISDPGHAWLKVPHKMLADLGIAEQITTFSYSRGEYAYLEEDQDAGTFFNAYRAKHGHDPKIRERNSPHRPSRVRNYAQYNPVKAAILREHTADLMAALQQMGKLQLITIGG